jgi:hypothetical protein
MPDLNHSNKPKQRLFGTRLPVIAEDEGIVTFGARKTHQGLPFLMGVVDNRI